MTELARAPACDAHGLYRLAVEVAYVDVEATADGGDVLDVLGLVGHDGTPAAGEHRICDVVDGDVVGDVMHERRCLTYSAQSIRKHGLRLLSQNKRTHPFRVCPLGRELAWPSEAAVPTLALPRSGSWVGTALGPLSAGMRQLP